MASLALHLKSRHLKPFPSLSSLSLSHPFSSSSSSNNNNNNDNNDKPYPFSSSLSGIKSKLQQQNQQQQPPGFRQHQQLNSNNRNVPSTDEIRKNLSDFRRRSSVPPPDFATQQKTNTTPFQNLNSGNRNLSSGDGKVGLSFDKIRESLRLMKGAASSQSAGGSTVKENMSLNSYRQSLKMQPPMPGGGGGGVRGSIADLPVEVFGKELEEQGKGADEVSEDDVSNFDLIRIYNHEELGQKLRELRPEVNKEKKEESWFTISELGERLKKLKVMEKEQAYSTPGGKMLAELRKGVSAIKFSDKDKDKPKNVSFRSLGLLNPQSFTKSPPKEHLIEKYFHPDNMSAEEKLKLKLKKVRDEFKMHESDCGSTRVQIAQLTTEILHLSSVLHKKDKHSRKGLQAKVQQRKKLLKYLRRTDWESYCFVLSKLGLRDNPDYKN